MISNNHKYRRKLPTISIPYKKVFDIHDTLNPTEILIKEISMN